MQFKMKLYSMCEPFGGASGIYSLECPFTASFLGLFITLILITKLFLVDLEWLLHFGFWFYDKDQIFPARDFIKNVWWYL